MTAKKIKTKPVSVKKPEMVKVYASMEILVPEDSVSIELFTNALFDVVAEFTKGTITNLNVSTSELDY